MYSTNTAFSTELPERDSSRSKRMSLRPWTEGGGMFGCVHQWLAMPRSRSLAMNSWLADGRDWSIEARPCIERLTSKDFRPIEVRGG